MNGVPLHPELEDGLVLKVRRRYAFKEVFRQAGNTTELHEDHVGPSTVLCSDFTAAADAVQQKGQQQAHHIFIHLPRAHGQRPTQALDIV